MAAGDGAPQSPRSARRSAAADARAPDLVVGTFDFEADDEGALRVFGTVENRGDAERTGTVVVTVETDGGSETREVDIAVDPGETVEWSVTFEVAYEEFSAGGDLNVDLA